MPTDDIKKFTEEEFKTLVKIILRARCSVCRLPPTPERAAVLAAAMVKRGGETPQRVLARALQVREAGALRCPECAAKARKRRGS